MRIESKLCYISENKAVVKVKGWLNDKNLGSALADGTTAEIAEDRAIERLKKRLDILKKDEFILSHINNNEYKSQSKIELTSGVKLDSFDGKNEPSDWSKELASIDLEIKRLKWTRDDEKKFIEENLGYNDRNKITKYNELVNYLSLLKKINKSNISDLKLQSRESMIEQSDLLLKDLSWDNKQGREFLQKEFNVSTRKELNEKQLTSFLAMLKSIRNQRYL